MTSHLAMSANTKFKQSGDQELKFSLQDRTAYMANRCVWTCSEAKLEEKRVLAHGESRPGCVRRDRNELKQIVVPKTPRDRHAAEENHSSDARSIRGQKLLLNPRAQHVDIGRGESGPRSDFRKPAPIIYQP